MNMVKQTEHLEEGEADDGSEEVEIWLAGCM